MDKEINTQEGVKFIKAQIIFGLTLEKIANLR